MKTSGRVKTTSGNEMTLSGVEMMMSSGLSQSTTSGRRMTTNGRTRAINGMKRMARALGIASISIWVRSRSKRKLTFETMTIGEIDRSNMSGMSSRNSKGDIAAHRRGGQISSVLMEVHEMSTKIAGRSGNITALL